MLQKDGILVLAEPVWLAKPVSSKVLRALGETEDSFLTESEMREQFRESGFQELENYVSSKEDWEFYVRPVYVAMQEIIEGKHKLAEEAQTVAKGFRAEYDAIGKHWNMVLWVSKSQ
jgi:hypothetical protein